MLLLMEESCNSRVPVLLKCLGPWGPWGSGCILEKDPENRMMEEITGQISTREIAAAQCRSQVDYLPTTLRMCASTCRSAASSPAKI